MKIGRFGPVVQIGTADDKEKPLFAQLPAEKGMETITLEEALKLFELPRCVGSLDGVDVIVTKGKFGPYIKYGDKNVALPRSKDPLKVSLEDCQKLISEASQKQAANTVMAEFPGSGIQIINGRYGPYLKYKESNYKLPRGTDAATQDEAKCKEIIGSSSPTEKKTKRFKKSK